MALQLFEEIANKKANALVKAKTPIDRPCKIPQMTNEILA